MKKIGVLSDTHIPKAASDLPEIVYAELKNIDMIFHAGDLVQLEVLEKLQKIAPTYAVFGNMDMDDVRSALPEKDTVTIEGFKIGIIHGYGPPAKLVESISKEF